MPVTDTTPRDDYIGNNSTDTYDWTFPVFPSSGPGLLVAITDTSGVVTEMALGADYNANYNADGTGSIILSAGNLADDYLLAIVREEPLTQLVALTQSNSYRPQSMQNVVDRLTRMVQQVDEKVRHAIRLPLAEDADGILGSATARASKLVGFGLSGGLALVDREGSGGGGGSGTGLGTSVKAAPFLATGDGIADDRAAIQACIDAVTALGGGVVYFPRGTYYVPGTAKLSVQFGTRLVGESMDSVIIRGPGFEAFGDNVTFEDLEFRDPSVDGATPGALPCTLKTIDHSHFAVRRCRLNRAWIDVRNSTESTRQENIVVRDNYFTGDFTTWIAVTGCNLITVMGGEGVDISNNRAVDITFPHRILKIQASTFFTGVGQVIGAAHTTRCVISGNVFVGTMKSEKQCVDLFSGCSELVFQGNIFDITSVGSGFTHFLETKSGQTSAQESPWTKNQVVRGNYFSGAPTYAAAFFSGAYSLAWESGDNTVDFSGNLIRHDSLTAGVCVEFRGMHNVQCSANTVVAVSTAVVYYAFSFGNCKNIVCNGNFSDKGSITAQGGVSTTGGDPYTGATDQVTVVGNVLRNGRSDQGIIRMNGLVGTPDFTCLGNTADSDLGLGIQAIIYLRDSTFGSVLCIGNNGDTTNAGRNRYLEVGTISVVLRREYLNSWQTDALQVYDEANRRLEVGVSVGSIDLWLQAAAGAEASLIWRQNAVHRLIQKVTTTGLDYQFNARDTAGLSIDNPLSWVLASAGLITIGGSTSRSVAFTGVIRPSVDALNDIGSQSQRWRNFYGQGSIHAGVRYITAAGTQSITDQDHVIIVDCTLGNVTLSLPAGTTARNGKKLKIYRIDNSANTLTIQRNAAPDTIITAFTGANSFTIAGGGRAELAYLHDITAYVRNT